MYLHHYRLKLSINAKLASTYFKRNVFKVYFSGNSVFYVISCFLGAVTPEMSKARGAACSAWSLQSIQGPQSLQTGTTFHILGPRVCFVGQPEEVAEA